MFELASLFLAIEAEFQAKLLTFEKNGKMWEYMPGSGPIIKAFVTFKKILYPSGILKDLSSKVNTHGRDWHQKGQNSWLRPDVSLH